jgi:hypothetical protein
MVPGMKRLLARSRPLWGLGLLLACGCATSLSSFQPAHVLPAGHVSLAAGLDGSIPTGAVTRTIDTARALANANMLSEQDKRTIFAGGFNLALSPPSVVEHIGLTYSPADRWEVGLRYASHAWRIGGRRQLLQQALDGTGWDVTVGLGLQRFSFSLPIDEVIPIVRLEEFTRWNLDIPLVAGRRGDFYRIWGGPRLVFSDYGAELVLRAPGSAGSVANEDIASVEGRGTYLGLQGGAALGYRVLFLAFELTVVRFLGAARLSAFGSNADIETGTWVVYPGVAILGEW